MIKNNNFNLSANAQVNNNLDVRIKHEHDGERGYTDDPKAGQSGRSMIEMLGVLAIVGVLSVGGIAGYSKAMMKFKINKTAEQISHIVTNIRTLYAQQTSYTGLNSQTAYQMGVIPDSLTTTNSWPFITGTFGGIEIDQNDGDYITKRFYIESRDLPKEACIALLTMDWGKPTSSGLTAMGTHHVDSVTKIYRDIKTIEWNEEKLGDAYGAKYLPFTVAKAADLCNCDKCNIMWSFQ